MSDAPGLGIDLNAGAIKEHPYDPQAFLNIFESGWEKAPGNGKELKLLERAGCSRSPEGTTGVHFRAMALALDQLEGDGRKDGVARCSMVRCRSVRR